MATGKQWKEHFEKKSQPYLINQVHTIDMIFKDTDKKIIFEFQLSYLSVIRSIIKEILSKKFKDNTYGGVF